MLRQALILAGGKGTRLRERLNGRPKPLVEIGGVPLLERQVTLAKRHGIDGILVLVNHAAEQIVEFCASRDNWGIDVTCIDDGEPAGTAGAVLRILDRLAGEFLVLYGDTMLEVDLTRFCKFHDGVPDAAATLFLHPNDHPEDSDLVEIDDEGRVTAFHPYPHDPARLYPNLVNAALYAVRKSALAPWQGQAPLDFGKELFPAMLHAGACLYGYNSPEYIKDCGTPQRLDKVSADLASGRITAASLTTPQQAVLIDRDGTINTAVGYVVRAEQLSLIPGVAEAIARLNRSTYRTVVVTNQPVIARGDCTAAELRRIHWAMERGLSEQGAYIDRIFICPHHPDRGFPGEIPALKIRCDCRKPNTGMIHRAIAELNIDPEGSWMIGDSTADLLAAQRAGLRSILVETGAAGLDGRYSVTPQFTAPDLLGAVTFILDEYPGLSRLCASMAERIRPRDIVYIGGLSRSGKTTFAHTLCFALRKQGLSGVVVGADRWLRDESQRNPGIFGRYDVAAAAAAVRDLAARREASIVPLPVYDRRTRSRAKETEPLTIGQDAVILVEGTVALQIAEAVGHRDHRYFVEIDEAIRRERVMREYRVRGCDPDQAEAIYALRQVDETPAIMATAASADYRIALP